MLWSIFFVSRLSSALADTIGLSLSGSKLGCTSEFLSNRLSSSGSSTPASFSLSLPMLGLLDNDFLDPFSLKLFKGLIGRKTEEGLRQRRRYCCKYGCLKSSAAWNYEVVKVTMDHGVQTQIRYGSGLIWTHSWSVFWVLPQHALDKLFPVRFQPLFQLIHVNQ